MIFMAPIALIALVAVIVVFWPQEWGGKWFCTKGFHSLLWWRGAGWYCTRCGQEVSDER